MTLGYIDSASLTHKLWKSSGLRSNPSSTALGREAPVMLAMVGSRYTVAPNCRLTETALLLIKHATVTVVDFLSLRKFFLSVSCQATMRCPVLSVRPPRWWPYHTAADPGCLLASHLPVQDWEDKQYNLASFPGLIPSSSCQVCTISTALYF